LRERRSAVGALNRAIDMAVHPMARENPWLWVLDGFLHGCVEQNPAETIRKFLKYNLPRITEGLGRLVEAGSNDFPSQINDLFKMLSSNPEAAGLAASLGAIALGAALALDDYADLGKVGDERDPPRPHHYQYGLALLLSGVAGTCVSGLALLKRFAGQRKVKKPPRSLLEGAPAELVEAFR